MNRPPHPNPCPVDEAKIYPAEFHFRIIVEPGAAIFEAVSAELSPCEITQPLRRGRQSRGGRYLTLQVSLRLHSRQEHQELDLRLRATEGVRLLL